MTPQHMNPKPPPEDPEEVARDEAISRHLDEARDRPDGHNPWPFWYGWALRDAFIAGAKWQETRARKEQVE